MNGQFLAPNIGVKNVGETVTFYTTVLGFQLVMSAPEEGELVWAMVSAGKISMMFQELDCLTDEYPQLSRRSANACMTFYIKVKEMTALYKKLAAAGYVIKELHTTCYGAEEFAIQDNNGLILTITEDIQ